ncbi:hypothetical protein ACLQ3A_30830, partial [Micromonospora zamorensis]|uniref:hypothetical protein n=1 Tax=Micromonospora zamorensis TaxID=709883 RepID=UPI003CF6D3AD
LSAITPPKRPTNDKIDCYDHLSTGGFPGAVTPRFPGSGVDDARGHSGHGEDVTSSRRLSV